MSDQEKIKDFRLEVEALKFAILGIYSELEKRNIDAKEFITTSSKSADLQNLHHKFALYTTNFTEPLSYQDSAFLKLPKFP